MRPIRQNDQPHLAKPLLMRLGGSFAALYCAGATLLVALGFARRIPYVIDGWPVSREDWLRLAVPLFTITIVLMAAIAYGLLRERAWSRHVVLMHWAAVGGYGLILLGLDAVETALAVRVAAQGFVGGAFSVWYFYRKPNVVAYFQSLQKREATDTAP